MVGDSRFRRLARYAFFCQHNILYSGRELCSHHVFTARYDRQFSSAAVLLLLYFFGAKGVKMRSAWLPAVIAVPVLADFVMFFYYLFRVILFGVDFTWQTVPSFIYAAAVAVFLVLYYVGLVKERKGKQTDI